MVLTTEQRAILESRIIEVDSWLARSPDVEILAAIDKYRGYWLSQKDAQGYQTAAQRAAKVAQDTPAIRRSPRDLALDAMIKAAAEDPNSVRAIKDYAATLP